MVQGGDRGFPFRCQARQYQGGAAAQVRSRILRFCETILAESEKPRNQSPAEKYGRGNSSLPTKTGDPAKAAVKCFRRVSG